MKTELYLENQRIDLSEDISTLLSFAIDDIKDIGSRNTSFSKTIVIPGTANNNLQFGHIFDVKAGSFYDPDSDNVGTNYNASKGAACVIFYDHIQVFKGVLRVLEMVVTDTVEYECAVFGELGGLVAKIGSGKLEDLDFSAYDHVWDETAITDSWVAAPGTGYFYPLIDYGGVSALKVDYDIRALRPALYVREYIDKIITNAGYTYSSDLFDTTRFKRLIVPNNKKSLQTITNLVGEGTALAAQTIISNGLGGEHDIPQSVASGTDFTYLAGVWTYNGSDTKTFTLRVTAAGGLVMSNGNMYIGVKKNTVSQFQYTPGFTVATGSTYSITFDYLITLSTGDTFSIYATRNGSGTYSLTTTNFVVDILSPVAIVADTTPGQTITINDTIPKNILQKDFLSSIIKLFNLYVYEDTLKPKFLNITPYVDFYNSTDVLDWTYKLDRSKATHIKPMSELNSRYYNFNFKPDSDYYNDLYKNRYNQVYGTYTYDSAFEFTNEKTDVDLIFSPSVLVGYTGKDKIVSALYKKNAGVEEKMDTNIRLMQSMNVTGVTSWDIKNGATVLSSQTNYGYGGHYNDPDAPANDIHWGVPSELFFTLLSGAVNVTQFNVYWSPYMSEITDKDSKLLTGFIKLNNKDIFEIDFAKLIYVDGAFFRLNKIEDWNGEDVCKVELLKVIDY